MEEHLSDEKRVLNGGETSPQTSQSHPDWTGILPIVPIPVFLILFLVLAILDIRTVFEPSWLLPTTNVLFLLIVPLAVVYIATQGYVQSGFITLLMLGAGTLAFGLGALLAGCVVSFGGPNANVTVYNFSALSSAMFHVLGAVLAFIGLDPQRDTRRKRLYATLTYLVIAILLTLLTITTVKGLTPVFFVQGEGPTIWRQTVLATAIVLFVMSGVLFVGLYLLSSAKVLYWYSLALFLIATGLICVLFQKSVGSPIGWLGRCGQYLGGIYLLVAVVSAWKDLHTKGLTMQGGIADLFRHRLAILVEERSSQLRRANEQLSNEVAERKKVEEELRQSRERLSLALEGATVGIWDWDLTTGKAQWSERNLRMLGYEPNGFEPNLKNWKKLVHPDDWSGVSKGFNDHIQGKSPVFEGEFRMQDKSGGWHWVAARGKVVRFTADEKPVRMTGVAIDITDRKLAEEALRTSEAQLSSAVMMAHLGPWEYDVLKDLFTFNDHFYQLFRTTAEQVGGYTMPSAEYARRFVHPDDMSAVGNEIRKSIEATDPDFSRQLEHRIVYADGEIGHISVRIFLVKDDLGRTVRTYGVNQDITERKKAEEDLHRLNRELQAIRSCNQTLLRAEDEQTLLNEVCRIICDEAGYRLAWVGYVENDAAKTVRPVAWAGFDSGYVANVNVSWSEDTEFGRGPGGTAVRSGKAIYVQDFATDPRTAPWRERGLQRGYRSSIALPLKDEFANVFGNIQMYSAEIGTFTPEEIRLMEELADDLAFGINVLRVRSESKRAEEALRQSEERRRLAQDAAKSGAWEWNLLTNENSWSDELWSLYGLEPHSCKPSYEAWRRTIHPEDRAAAEKAALEASRGRRELNAEWRVNDPRGEERWLMSRGVPVFDADGEATRYIGIVMDITDRKKAEAALKASEERYRNLFDNSPLGIISVNTEGRILEVNQCLLDILGSPSEEATKSINMLEFPLLVEAGISDAFRSCMTKGEKIAKDFPYTSTWGKLSHLRFVLTPVTDREGIIRGCQATVEDISHQAKLERQLLQAQKMEAVGTLAGGIAHDFNNILQAVLGYTELVLFDEDLPDRLRDDMEKVLIAGRNGADLVQRLLTFSRKSEAKPLDLDLNKRIRQTQKFLQRTIPKMIDIEMILAEDLAGVHADPTQMDQVLMNLAVNARDAMPDGGHLTIETANVFLDEEFTRTHPGAKRGEYVFLSVSDTGCGMDKETLDHIFEPFFTTKEAGKGTGLGLAMVYGIVHQHGGYITCYSEPGEGTTFKMYFPVIEMEIDQDVTESGPMPAFGTETILLVDDEEFVRDLGRRILERSGYTVLTAANGKEALELYRREKETISLVILDLIMPEMGGKQCLEELLKIDPGVKTLIASGFAANGQTKEAIETGARSFVEKPYNMRGMLRSVREVLDSE